MIVFNCQCPRLPVTALISELLSHCQYHPRAAARRGGAPAAAIRLSPPPRSEARIGPSDPPAPAAGWRGGGRA
eukprot:685519-Hanusia_phi.AAC.1